MNGPIARALLEDARQQVLDNRVFRLLLVGALVMILPTILVGFHEDSVDFLFGWKSLSYADLFASFGQDVTRFENPQVLVVGGIQNVVVQFLAGTVGLIFAISATAFFVPRMLERGAADVLFSKPVGRMTLLLSRYVAGLLFISTLAALLVAGMYLGLRLRSGYDDPGFLWGVVTLIYLFSVLHAFSIAMGTLTRSSTAAILLTIVLFSTSGCVHGAWLVKEYSFALHGSEDRGDAESPNEGGPAGRAEEEEIHPAARLGLLALDTLHFILPKTSDADILTQKLKRSLGSPALALVDTGGDLRVARDPEGYRLEGPRERDLGEEPARWIPRERDAEGAGAIEVRRRPRAMTAEEAAGPGGSSRGRWTAARAAKALAAELEADPRVLSGPETEDTSVPGARAVTVRWTAEEERGAMRHERVLFAFGDGLYEIEFVRPVAEAGGSADAEGDREDPERVRRRFLSGLRLGEEAGLDPASWYEKRFRLDAPLRYNPLFSVGSTLAFAALMLLVAWLKLRRMDF